jgi:hypothetical protein
LKVKIQRSLIAPRKVLPVVISEEVRACLSYLPCPAPTTSLHFTQVPGQGPCFESADGLDGAISSYLNIGHTPSFNSSRTTTMANATIDAPVVPILLVGDGEVGKSAFLSYVDRCSTKR